MMQGASKTRSFEDGGITVAIFVKYFASDILATGYVQYRAYHSDACIVGVGKPTDRLGKTFKHRSRNELNELTRLKGKAR
jgi:hypothetical protein